MSHYALACKWRIKGATGFEVVRLSELEGRCDLLPLTDPTTATDVLTDPTGEQQQAEDLDPDQITKKHRCQPLRSRIQAKFLLQMVQSIS